MSTQYTGHGAATGGLQGHSVGGDYPYTVIGITNRGGALMWAAYDTRSGSEGIHRRSYAEARLDIMGARVRNLMHS